jgi:hypothetical protein
VAAVVAEAEPVLLLQTPLPQALLVFRADLLQLRLAAVVEADLRPEALAHAGRLRWISPVTGFPS